MNPPEKPLHHCMLVVPVFNEQNNLASLYRSVHQSISKINDTKFNFVFVNDGSQDDSWDKIKDLAKNNSDIIGVDLSKNFGKEAALTAGVMECSDASFVICIDADLQHPPTLIPKMIDLWKKGNDTVIGIRRSTPGESLTRRLGSALFNKLMQAMSEIDHHRGSTDFRLFDKQVVCAINRLNESQRLFRGLADWVGFKKTYVYFDADERQFGNSTYSLIQLIGLAFISILAFSTWPLKAIAFLGITILSGSFLSFLLLVLDYFFLGYISASPLAMVSVIITGILGLVILILGIISLYLAQISREVLRRPAFIVREKIRR